MNTEFVTIEGRALKQAMKLARAIIERRNTIPILNMVMLELSDTAFTVTATDLDNMAVIDLDAIDGAGKWRVCLDARTFEGVAGVAGPAPIRIEPPERGEIMARVILGDGDVTYRMNTLPAEDFPMMKAERGNLIERFTNGMLTSTLDKVSWCVSTEETRYYLNGVAWQFTQSGKRFVATDGHRLALCRYGSDESPEAPIASRIIARKTVGILSKHFAGLDVAIYEADKPHMLDYVAPGVVMRSRLIDGTFPDVDRVVPRAEAIKHSVEFRQPEFAQAIERASVIGGEGDYRAIKFDNDNGRISIGQRSVDFGTAQVATTYLWPAGMDAFAFNGNYLKDIADHCTGRLTINMTDPSSPFTIADDDDTMTRVLMPMRA